MIVYTDENVDQSFDISNVPAGSSADARTRLTVRKHEDTGKVTLVVQSLRRGRNVNGSTWSRWKTKEWHSIRRVAAGYAVITSKLPRANKPMTRRMFKSDMHFRWGSYGQMFDYFDTELLLNMEEVYPYAQKYSDWAVNYQNHDPKFIAAFVGTHTADELTLKLFGKKRHTPELVAAVDEAENIYAIALAWAFRGLVPDENLLPLFRYSYPWSSSVAGASKVRKHLMALSQRSRMRLALDSPDPRTVRKLLQYHPLFMQGDRVTDWVDLTRKAQSQDEISRQLAIYNIKPTESIPIPRSLVDLNGYETFGYGYKMVLVDSVEELLRSPRAGRRVGMIIHNMATSREWYGHLYSGQRIVGNFRIDLVNNQLSSLLSVYNESLDDDVQREVVDAVTLYNFTANNFVGMAECLDD